jgi:hypothetical protein
MQGQEGNQEREGNQDEERQASNAGYMPGLRNQDVQNR